MALTIREIYGHPPGSLAIGEAARNNYCHFLKGPCQKRFSDGMPNGSCTAQAVEDPTPVIFCPQRLYAEDYKVLRDVATKAFPPSAFFLKPGHQPPPEAELLVLPFGQKMGGEIQIKMRGTAFSVDWILACVTRSGVMVSFVPVEIQTVDTTGNYRRQSWQIHVEHEVPGMGIYSEPPQAQSNFNFENVNKRILPQLISKSHALRREPRCTKGLFFVCPTMIYKRIFKRLGGEPEPYNMQPGSITFHNYDVDFTSSDDPRPLVLTSSMTTTTEQVALAFSSAVGLPPAGTYETAVENAVNSRLVNLSL